MQWLKFMKFVQYISLWSLSNIFCQNLTILWASWVQIQSSMYLRNNCIYHFINFRKELKMESDCFNQKISEGQPVKNGRQTCNKVKFSMENHTVNLLGIKLFDIGTDGIAWSLAGIRASLSITLVSFGRKQPTFWTWSHGFGLTTQHFGFTVKPVF